MESRLPHDDGAREGWAELLSKIVIKNFKSIEECELELKPLTILTGRNASGKSNFMEGIALLAQASRKNVKNLDAAIDGEFYNYDSLDSIIYKQDPSKAISFEIHVKPSNNLKSEIGVRARAMALKKINRKEIKSVGYFYSARGYEEYHQGIFINDNKLIEIEALISQQGKITFPGGYEDYVSVNVSFLSALFDHRSFIFREPRTRKPGDYEPEININDYSKLAEIIIDEINRSLKKLFVLSTLRGLVNFRSSNIDPEWVGRDGREVIPILSKCFARRRYEKKAQKIIEWANKFGIKGIKAGFWGPNTLGSDYIDSEIEIPLPINLASFGSRQILTIITQIFWSDPGSCILIEEPELSLHPEAQVKLQKLFADAIGEGRQIICSTHSPFTILALSRSIRDELAIDDIAIYEVNKEKQGTKADKLILNDKGFIEGGIPSFMEVEAELYKEWMESLEEEK